MKRLTLADRLWSKVRKHPGEGCWEWTGALHEAGYGIIGLGSRDEGTDRAHRVSWRLVNGPIPVGMVLCHRCDNRTCVRPDHLFLGTHKDNSDDKWSKGRASPPPLLIGQRNRRARVVEFRGVKKCLAEWSVETGISAGTIKQRLNAGWPVERALTEPSR